MEVECKALSLVATSPDASVRAVVAIVAVRSASGAVCRSIAAVVNTTL